MWISVLLFYERESQAVVKLGARIAKRKKEKVSTTMSFRFAGEIVALCLLAYVSTAPEAGGCHCAFACVHTPWPDWRHLILD